MEVETTEAERLPLDDQFQALLVRELTEDRGFAAQVLQHLQPRYFDNPIHAWAVETIIAYRTRYDVPPTWAQIVNQTRGLEPAERDLYAAYLTQLGASPRFDDGVKRWVSDQVLHFVRDRFFLAAHKHAYVLHQEFKRPVDAQNYLIEQMAKLGMLNFRPGDRAFHFEELATRQEERRGRDRATTVITTGFPTLDRMLAGNTPAAGMEVCRLVIWMGYAKGGKSTMLIANGIAACRAGANVLHFVYEGTRQETQARYDAAFAQVDSRCVDRGEIPADVYEKMVAEYNRLQGRLVVRAFTTAEENAWNSSVQTIVDELQFLKQAHNWEPQVIVVDYVDLLTGRDKHYKSATERQTAACQDLKTLANRGYLIYTASQPQRPEQDADIKPHLIRSTQIADCYAKVRIADFIGSINSTLTEREHKVARLYAEMARGAPADLEYVVRADFPCMTIREEAGLASPHTEVSRATQTRRLGEMPAPGPRQSRAF